MSKLLLRVCITVGLVVFAPTVTWAQSESVEYYGTDAVGSIRVVYDGSGNVLARQDYGPFGLPLLPGTQLPPEEFVGNGTDNESDQAYFNARQFLSRTGRFAQVDPVYEGLLQPQGWNRYAYAVNNPLTYVDAMGLDCPPATDTSTCVSATPPDANFWIGFGLYSLPVYGEFPLRQLERLAAKGTNRRQAPSTTTTTPKTDPPPSGPPTPSPCDPKTGANCAPPVDHSKDFLNGIREAWRKGYYRCLVEKNIPGFSGTATAHVVTDVATEAANHFAPQLAGAYYHFTDRRFSAWGKYSKVLVPQAAASIELWAGRLNVAAWAYADYELFKSIDECVEVLH